MEYDERGNLTWKLTLAMVNIQVDRVVSRNGDLVLSVRLLRSYEVNLHLVDYQ